MSILCVVLVMIESQSSGDGDNSDQVVADAAVGDEVVRKVPLKSKIGSPHDLSSVRLVRSDVFHVVMCCDSIFHIAVPMAPNGGEETSSSIARCFNSLRQTTVLFFLL